MKKRILSVILSFSIVFGNCFNSFAVIAESVETSTNTGKTETSEENTENESDSTLESETETNTESDTSENDDKEEDDDSDITEKDDKEEDNTSDVTDEGKKDDTDDPQKENKSVIRVSKIEELTIYNGQDPDKIYNYEEAGKPRYMRFFGFYSSDSEPLPDDFYNSIKLNFELLENDNAYRVNFVFNNSEFESKYAFEYDGDFRLVVRNDYNPGDIKVERVVVDRNVYLECKSEGYLISEKNDPDSFSESRIENTNIYYLRNDNKESIEYHAISKEIAFDGNSELSVSSDAVITPDIDFSKTTAYNKDVEITITAFAKSEKATISLKNNNKSIIESKEMALVGTEDDGENKGKNKFEYKYTFTAPSSGVYKITNLQAYVSEEIGEESGWIPLQLKDKNDYNCDDLRLECEVPHIECRGGPWKEKDNYKFEMHAYDHEVKIVSIEYKIDNMQWIKEDVSKMNYWNMYPSGRDYSWQMYIPISKLNPDKNTIYVRAVDEAGNIKIIYRYPSAAGWGIYNEISPELFNDTVNTIKEIELYYYNSQNDNWIKISNASSLGASEFGNAINKPLQIRVKSDKTNKIYINGALMQSLDSDDSESDEKVFKYDFGIGTDDDVIFRINEVNADIGLDAPALSDKLGFKLNSKHLTIEDTKPSSTLKRPDFAKNNVSVSDKWYGINEENGKFEINVKDDKSGIRSIQIKDNGSNISGSKSPIKYSINESQEFKEITGELSEINFSALDGSTKNVKIIIPVGIFEDNSHSLEIKVYDNAGNYETGFISINGNANQQTNTDTGIKSNKPFEFSTDFTRPTGEITVDPSGSIIIDKKLWFDRSDNVGLDFTITDDNPNKVIWKSNGVWLEQKFPDGEADISAFLNDVNSPLSTDHSYTISAVFYDKAGNSSKENPVESKTFYKDIENPVIDSVSVSRAPESGFGKVLRIISFGIFSNDKVIVSVKAHDADRDSGLNNASLEISLNDGKSYEGMTYDNEVYKYSIPVSDNPKSGIIAIRVTDRFGHQSDIFEKITSGDEGSVGDSETASKDFIIEEIQPSVSLTIPASDGITRTDSNIWYNSDKDISISVKDTDSGIHSIFVSANDEQIQNDSDRVDFIKMKDNESHEYHFSTEAIRSILGNNGKIPDDGHYVIKVIAEDNAGNITEEKVDYYLDYEAPKVDKIEFSIPSADGYGDVSQFITELEYGFYFKTNLIATVNVSDAAPTSGLHRIEYVLVDYNNGEKGEEHPGTAYIDENGKASFDIHAKFKGQILVKAFDYVENESGEISPELFVVDTFERHESEKHIVISGMETSAFKDSEDHWLFRDDVNLAVSVTDTMSGIREISYSLDSEKEVQEMRTIILNNTGYSVNQDLGDGWIIKSMDENLVTEVIRNYSFSSDNNNIKIQIAMKDRSNNESNDESDIFSVDKTDPIINVVFEQSEGNGNCYRVERKATITVIERNFDTARIISDIQNSIGGIPAISSFTDVSKTEHTASIIFGEGDYSFSLNGTDRCDHTAVVNYSGGNERDFRVDMTDPVLVHNFDQFINNSDNSFNVDKEMTFTITEHNFNPDRVKITVYRAPSGEELTSSNRADCTSEYISSDMWNKNGDINAISFSFKNDYVYQVEVRGTDESGRAISETISPVFEIDKTKPVLKTPKNFDVMVYTSKNLNKELQDILFDDYNIAKVDYTVVAYQMKINDDKVGYDMNVKSNTYESKNDTVKIGNEFFNNDGIYEVKCTPYDVAGNAGEETTHTYVIQRTSDFLVYIPDSNKERKTGLYKFDQKGIRAADFEDIEIISYVTNDKTVSIEVDGVETADSDLNVKIDDEKINQINMYDITLKNSYISHNFSGDTVDTDLALNAVAKNGDSKQIITLGHIYIDNVKPMGEYEKSLQDIGFFDGFYGMDSKTLMIEGVSPDIDVSRCTIMLNDDELTYESGGFQYDEQNHTISFTVNNGYTSIRPTLVDKAGNINNLAMVKKVYVGSIFARWWYLFVLGGLSVVSVSVYGFLSLIRRKKS